MVVFFKSGPNKVLTKLNWVFANFPVKKCALFWLLIIFKRPESTALNSQELVLIT